MPELVVEVLSPGPKNIQRDRRTKLKLYARRGVDEYWIVDWLRRIIDVYRLGGTTLAHVATLTESDTLTSPLMPGMDMPLARIFVGLPTEEAPEL